MLFTLLLLLVIVSSVFLMLYAGVALIQDRKYFTSAPKDVQKAIQPRKERFRGAHALGWLLMGVAAVLVIGALIAAIADGIKKHYSFGRFFARFLILLEGYKIWDMLFLDDFLLTKSRFYQHYYPEVKDCESLKKPGFNRKSQMTKLLTVFPVIAAVIAGGCTLLKKLLEKGNA